MQSTLRRIIGVLAILASSATAMAVSFTGSYSENFDSMGTAGTAPPTGWTVKTGDGGSNTTWSTSIPASGTLSVATMINAATPLTVVTSPTIANHRGYNAALDRGHTSDRVLSTSPTGVTGAGLELLLTNNTGTTISSLNLSYDIVRFTVVGTANELPGYQLFYSLDGSTWNNVPALNPTLSGPGGVIVPNTAGITSVLNASIALVSGWANNTNLLMRWVDDNAVQTSPDQIIGLNNVAVAVPEPASLGMLVAGSLCLLKRRRM